MDPRRGRMGRPLLRPRVRPARAVPQSRQALRRAAHGPERARRPLFVASRLHERDRGARILWFDVRSARRAAPAPRGGGARRAIPNPTIRPRPPREAGDPRAEARAVEDARPRARQESQRALQTIGDGDRGRLGAMEARGLRPLSRGRDRRVRGRSPHGRLRLARLHARGDYARVMGILDPLTATLSPKARDAVLGGNAERFYGL